MIVAFVGKGGSGKTTLSGAFALHAKETTGKPVLAFDADVNQHLARELGMDEQTAASLPGLGTEDLRVKAYLRGTRGDMTSPDQMYKTSPPARGSRLVTLTQRNPLFDYFSRDVNGVQVMACGKPGEEDIGVACYHKLNGPVELLLNHTQDGRHGEDGYVVVDMMAGADQASALFTRPDMTFIVIQPTEKGLSVYRDYKETVRGYNVATRVIGNQVIFPEQEAFIRASIPPEELVAVVPYSREIARREMGEPVRPEDIRDSFRPALQAMLRTVDASTKDWTDYRETGIRMHELNCRSWIGKDALSHIDRGFRYPYELQPRIGEGTVFGSDGQRPLGRRL